MKLLLRTGKDKPDFWTIQVPRKIKKPIVEAHVTLDGRGGPLLTPEQWTKITQCLEEILVDSIQEPPNRECIVVNVAELIKLLDLQEV